VTVGDQVDLGRALQPTSRHDRGPRRTCFRCTNLRAPSRPSGRRSRAKGVHVVHERRSADRESRPERGRLVSRDTFPLEVSLAWGQHGWRSGDHESKYREARLYPGASGRNPVVRSAGLECGTAPSHFSIRRHTIPALDAWTLGVDLFRAWSHVRTDDPVCGGAAHVALECGEERPWWPVPREDWRLEDPKGKPLEAVGTTWEGESCGSPESAPRREADMGPGRGARPGSTPSHGPARALEPPTSWHTTAPREARKRDLLVIVPRLSEDRQKSRCVSGSGPWRGRARHHHLSERP